MGVDMDIMVEYDYKSTEVTNGEDYCKLTNEF